MRTRVSPKTTATLLSIASRSQAPKTTPTSFLPHLPCTCRTSHPRLLKTSSRCSLLAMVLLSRTSSSFRRIARWLSFRWVQWRKRSSLSSSSTTMISEKTTILGFLSPSPSFETNTFNEGLEWPVILNLNES